MENQIDYFDKIINDIREEVGVEEFVTEAPYVFVKEGAGTVLAKIAGKQVVDKIQYPLDQEVKETIKKKVKLEMKLRKIKRENPKDKETIKELTQELKDVDKLYKIAVAISKTDRTKDILRQYKKKCEVEFGPRSLYYASIRVPEIQKESVISSLLDDVYDDYCIESEMEEVAMNFENVDVSKDINPDKPPENNDSGAAEAAARTAEVNKNNEKTENSIGAMLPQTGSTDGLGNPNDVIKDINTVDKKVDKDELDGIDLPDDIELESTLEYVMNPEYGYTYYVETEIKKFIKDVKCNIELSASIKKAAVEKALIKSRLKVAKKKGTDRARIDELKRNLIEKEKEIRILKKELNPKDKAAVDALVKKVENEIDGNVKKENINNPNEKPLETVTDKKNTEMGSNIKETVESTPFELLYPSDVIEAKLENARNDNNFDLIRKYENQLKYYKMNPDENIIVIESDIDEAANIDAEIKPVIEILNQKGYKTKYSSAGHVHLRKKTDGKRDGVYHDKLYSDARIMFDGDFKFPNSPKHWFWKNVDGKDYLDIEPIYYNPKDGSPDEAFAKWKNRYMETLRTWADNLPDRVKSNAEEVETKDRKGRDIKVESVDDLMSNLDFIYDVMTM